LKWIVFPESGEAASTARIRDRTAWDANIHRTATVKSLIGTVDAQTRLARVLLTVADPLARTSDAPPLILNTVLEVRIEGRPLPGVIRLERPYLRGNRTVWVMEDEKLSIREVDVLFQDANYAYLSGGLSDGEKVVTTNLATVAEGTPLRVETESTEASQP
jgi:hypothetical protein